MELNIMMKINLQLSFRYDIIIPNGGKQMNQKDMVLEFAKKNNGIIKTDELKEYNINRSTIKGIIEKINRSLYITADTFEDEYYSLQNKCPKAIFSHETALYFHDLTDRTPIKLMVTIPSDSNSRYVKDERYELGKIKVKTPYGNFVYCYDMERTICDIVRNKEKIERFQYVDALKRYAKLNTRNSKKLYNYAKKFKIEKELQNYMKKKIFIIF